MNRLQHLGERPREEALSAPRTAAPSPTRGARGGASGVGSAWAQTPPFSWAEPCSSVQESRSSKIHPQIPAALSCPMRRGLRVRARALPPAEPRPLGAGGTRPPKLVPPPACRAVPCRAAVGRRSRLSRPRGRISYGRCRGGGPWPRGPRAGARTGQAGVSGGSMASPGLLGPPGHPPQPAPARTFLLLHQFNKLAGFFGGAKGRGAENAG